MSIDQLTCTILVSRYNYALLLVSTARFIILNSQADVTVVYAWLYCCPAHLTTSYTVLSRTKAVHSQLIVKELKLENRSTNFDET